ncbi:hypothetical protein DQ354_09465 [Arthrobacter sp. AQ5-06]|nr:hypothetical protein DQ354_09465 [Arthrobacter sp. AQ5-06]
MPGDGVSVVDGSTGLGTGSGTGAGSGTGTGSGTGSGTGTGTGSSPGGGVCCSGGVSPDGRGNGMTTTVGSSPSSPYAAGIVPTPNSRVNPTATAHWWAIQLVFFTRSPPGCRFSGMLLVPPECRVGRYTSSYKQSPVTGRSTQAYLMQGSTKTPASVGGAHFSETRLT